MSTITYILVQMEIIALNSISNTFESASSSAFVTQIIRHGRSTISFSDSEDLIGASSEVLSSSASSVASRKLDMADF